MINQYPFNDETNYVFDSNYIEFVNGKAQLKNINTRRTFCARYDSSVDANFGNGVLSATLGSTPAYVSGGFLRCDGGKSLSYPALDNFSATQQGCIRVRWQPYYSGVPSHDQYLFYLSGSLNHNRILVFHYPSDGKIYVQFCDKDGVSIISTSFAVSISSGNTYEFEVSWDIDTGGHTYIFWDGVLKQTLTSTGIRTLADITNMYFGNSNSNYIIDSVILFDSAQHTHDYTPDTKDEYYYLNGDTNICVYAPIPCDLINSVSWAASTNVRTAFSPDNGVTRKYWDGSAWVTSDCSFNQANDQSALTSQVLAQLLSEFSLFKWGAILHGDGDTQEWIDILSVDYHYHGINGDVPTPCIVYGNEYDVSGEPISGMSISANISEHCEYSSEAGINKQSASTVTDSDGYWSLSLLPNSQLTPNDSTYTFRFDNGARIEQVTVPNEVTKKYYEINSIT